MHKLYCVDLSGMPIFEQLCLEEALLRADNRNWYLYNENEQAAIVMGISGKVDHLIDLDKLRANPMPLIRRFSGGGTVVVDRNTLFTTWIVNQSDLPDIAIYPSSILRWTESLYSPIFPPGEFRCLENDYALGDRKCGGNAQYLCRHRWLHHSSLLWDLDPKKMATLLVPSRQPHYRQGRSHLDFLTTLHRYFSKKVEIFEGLKEQLKRSFTLVSISTDEIKESLNRPHRRTTQFIL